ncbi:hypothetical protein SCAB_61371 [Streptomyces scabiei 87.22]|uniref:Uncharacterized protein n=1 Tax=Streptomyces scabiei (strain 87.22) TaxID=680198 RepID=C9Z969_STRSW|nr:hypothetical protein SCAB_61371 [Streptomyces scabiei 87.22]
MLEHGRALLAGGTRSSRRTPSASPALGPRPGRRHRPCGVLEAALVGARRRRAPHLWPAPARPAVEDDALTRDLVRAYVLPEDEATRRLASSTRRSR